MFELKVLAGVPIDQAQEAFVQTPGRVDGALALRPVRRRRVWRWRRPS
jgi:hypothetical protein